MFAVNGGVRTDEVLATDVDGAGARLETEHSWRCDGEAAETHLEQSINTASAQRSTEVEFSSPHREVT